VAPQGNWATVLGPTLPVGRRLETWPVVSADGRLAYTLDRFAAVNDADFSAEGDTLFVLAQTAWDSTAEGWVSTSWIEAIAVASGAQVGGVTLPDHPVALLVDPERPWLFVLGSGVLTVVDRRDWTLATVISSGCVPLLSQPRTLVLDGDAVHAIVSGLGPIGVCHFDIL
jgi:hypothetical protein